VGRSATPKGSTHAERVAGQETRHPFEWADSAVALSPGDRAVAKPAEGG